jgi:hypothetical protein
MKKQSEKIKDEDSDAPILHKHLTLIEVAEPGILEELQVDRQIGWLIVTRLSDRVAVVAPGKIDQLVKHLLKAGHTPKIIGG